MADRHKGLEARLEQADPIPLDARLACEPGEILALVGPSGSGKSTILRAIAGLNRINAGHIACNGSVWFDAEAGISVPTRHRRVGFVFQHYGLFPHLTALANVMEGLDPGLDREDRARDLLSLVRLEGLESRYPSELSGGQQQRVAVARALARDPEVLLLDEPFSAVDRATRQRLYRELGQLRSQLRMPVVLVTHDLDEAVQLCDRISILHRGKTLQEGKPREVLTHPANRDVARLIDRKNIFSARISAQVSSQKITRLDWNGIALEAAYHGQFPVGDIVDWVIPMGSVILHRRRAPSRGVRENPVRGTIESMVQLGEMVTVSVNIGDDFEHPLFMAIPLHAAERNSLVPGLEIGVSLRAEDIHLMAPIDHDRDEHRS